MHIRHPFLIRAGVIAPFSFSTTVILVFVGIMAYTCAMKSELDNIIKLE